MSLYEIVISSVLLLVLAGAIAAFIRTPNAERFALKPPEKEPGGDYAPEYTEEERIATTLKALAYGVPIVAICEFWFFDWLTQFSANAHCYNIGDVNGVHLVFYGLFVLMPFSIGFFLFLSGCGRSIKVIRLGQNPLPNEKVVRPTKYQYGRTARIEPIIYLSAIAFFVGLSVWGGFQAYELTKEIQPCKVNKIVSSAPVVPDGRYDASLCFVCILLVR